MSLGKYRPRALFRRNLVKFIEIINFKYSKKNAIKVLDEKWDYLIILDSCRYDMFKLVVKKEVPYVITGGSTTQEWLRWNFDREFCDLVCVAGKHEFSSININRTFGRNPFFKVIDIWHYGWDNNLKTVLPEKVTEAAFEALKLYPNKRMIIHYRQPHYPYIGDKDFIDLQNKLYPNFNIKGQWDLLTAIKKKDVSTQGILWNAIKDRKLSVKRVWIAYIKTLNMVLKEVDKLVQELHGKIVISSDHGNLLGEYLRFGHIPHLRLKHLVKVPWFVINNDEKKQIFEDKDN